MAKYKQICYFSSYSIDDDEQKLERQIGKEINSKLIFVYPIICWKKIFNIF